MHESMRIQVIIGKPKNDALQRDIIRNRFRGCKRSTTWIASLCSTVVKLWKRHRCFSKLTVGFHHQGEWWLEQESSKIYWMRVIGWRSDNTDKYVDTWIGKKSLQVAATAKRLLCETIYCAVHQGCGAGVVMSGRFLRGAKVGFLKHWEPELDFFVRLRMPSWITFTSHS